MCCFTDVKGMLPVNTKLHESLIVPLAVGDVLGCGVSYLQSTIFAMRNGELGRYHVHIYNNIEPYFQY